MDRSDDPQRRLPWRARKRLAERPPERGRRDELNAGHSTARAGLRIAAVVLLLAGGLFVAVGVIDFFAAFGGSGSPKKFWCIFVGGPLLALGGALAKFAFLGVAARFLANEVAPVGKDVVNYMATGTAGAVREVAAAAAQGVRSAAGAKVVLRCHQCNADVELPAKFCKACGVALEKTRPCPQCGERNDPDARFCDECGKPMAPA